MGLCASASRNSHSAVKLDMPFASSSDAAKQHLINKQRSDGFDSRVSPLNQGNNSHPSYGSKEEIFLDSQAWLDSDCDDDFRSVNGEFTPSCGNTPLHGSAAGSPKSNKAISLQSNGALSNHQPPPLKIGLAPSDGIEPESVSLDVGAPQGENCNPDSLLSTPTDKKSKLMDLFRQSRTEGEIDALTFASSESVTEAKQPLEIKPSIPKSANGTPHISGTNSVSSDGRITDEDLVKRGKEKSLKSAALSCLPRLGTCRSFSEKKTSTSSPISMDG
ncbi:hypothetical protein AKJ16_DCAP00071 [Drosera capensis]